MQECVRMSNTCRIFCVILAEIKKFGVCRFVFPLIYFPIQTLDAAHLESRSPCQPFSPSLCWTFWRRFAVYRSLCYIWLKPQWVYVWEDEILLAQRHANSIKLNHLQWLNVRMSVKFPCKWAKINGSGSAEAKCGFIILRAMTYLLLLNFEWLISFINLHFKYA